MCSALGLSPDMRTLIVLLALFAAAKVGVKEWLYRSATDDVIVSAYRQRAADACTKTEPSKKAGFSDKTWSDRANALLSIGNTAVPVYVWQTDHEAWAKKFRNPYLTLVLEKSAGGVRCDYDIVNGVATARTL